VIDEDEQIDGRRQRRNKQENQDQTTLTVKTGKKYLAVNKQQWVRDEANDSMDYFMFRRKTKAEILEAVSSGKQT
jgi:hypothetical protein